MAPENKGFFASVKSAFYATYEKVSPTVGSAYSTLKEAASAAGDLVEGTKSAWELTKAGSTLVKSGVKFSWNIGKVFLYDVPSTFAALYEGNEKEFTEAYEATEEDLFAANNEFCDGANAVVGMVQSAANVAYYAGDAVYHTAGVAYYASNTAINAGSLALEGAQAVTGVIADGANRVFNALEEAYPALSQREIEEGYIEILPAYSKFSSKATSLVQMVQKGLDISCTFGGLLIR